MKKLMFVLMAAAIMLFAVSAFCADGKMMFGVKAGLNMANLTGDNVDNTSIKMGMVGGAFMCYKITDIIAVQPELLFVMKGAKRDSAGSEEQWKINYIEIPLLLKVNMPTEGKIKPSLYAGPGIGILMSSKLDEVDAKDITKSSNISLIAGAAVAYQLEKGAISFEARYDVGLATIGKNASDDAGATEPSIKTSDISIMVGYAFAF
jgi:hypothetical protein